MFCKKLVYDNYGLTLPCLGPAHDSCYQANEALERTIQHLEISLLNDNDELMELRETVIAEDNLRNRSTGDDGIKLFEAW